MYHESMRKIQREKKKEGRGDKWRWKIEVIVQSPDMSLRVNVSGPPLACIYPWYGNPKKSNKTTFFSPKTLGFFLSQLWGSKPLVRYHSFRWGKVLARFKSRTGRQKLASTASRVRCRSSRKTIVVNIKWKVLFRIDKSWNEHIPK